MRLFLGFILALACVSCTHKKSHNKEEEHGSHPLEGYWVYSEFINCQDFSNGTSSQPCAVEEIPATTQLMEFLSFMQVDWNGYLYSHNNPGELRVLPGVYVDTNGVLRETVNPNVNTPVAYEFVRNGDLLKQVMVYQDSTGTNPPSLDVIKEYRFVDSARFFDTRRFIYSVITQPEVRRMLMDKVKGFSAPHPRARFAGSTQRLRTVISQRRTLSIRVTDDKALDELNSQHRIYFANGQLLDSKPSIGCTLENHGADLAKDAELSVDVPDGVEDGSNNGSRRLVLHHGRASDQHVEMSCTRNRPNDPFTLDEIYEEMGDLMKLVAE